MKHFRFFTVFCAILLSSTLNCWAKTYSTPSSTFEIFQSRHPELAEQALQLYDAGRPALLHLIYIWTELAAEDLREETGASSPQPPDETVVPYQVIPFALLESDASLLREVFVNISDYLKSQPEHIQVDFGEALLIWLANYVDDFYDLEISKLLKGPPEDERDEDEYGEEAEDTAPTNPDWIPVSEHEKAQLELNLLRFKSELFHLQDTDWKGILRYLTTTTPADQFLILRAQERGYSIRKILESLQAVHAGLIDPTPFLKNLLPIELSQIVDSFHLGGEILRTEGSAALRLYDDYQARVKAKKPIELTLRDLHERGFVSRNVRLHKEIELAFYGQERDVGKKVVLVVQPSLGRELLLIGRLTSQDQRSIEFTKNGSSIWIRRTLRADRNTVSFSQVEEPSSIEGTLMHVFVESPGEAETLDEMVLQTAQHSRAKLNPNQIKCDLIVRGASYEL